MLVHPHGCREATSIVGGLGVVVHAERLNAEWSKLGHDYWTSDCEMFARAFACYIKDKLAEKGITDDYLCGHCEADGCTKGEERKVINQKFDQLFAKLKSDKFF